MPPPPGLWRSAVTGPPTLALGPGLASLPSQDCCAGPCTSASLSPSLWRPLPGETPGLLLPLHSQGRPEGWEAAPRGRSLLGQLWGPQEKLLQSPFSVERKLRALAQRTHLAVRLCPARWSPTGSPAAPALGATSCPPCGAGSEGPAAKGLLQVAGGPAAGRDAVCPSLLGQHVCPRWLASLCWAGPGPQRDREGPAWHDSEAPGRVSGRGPARPADLRHRGGPASAEPRCLQPPAGRGCPVARVPAG